MVLMTSIPFLLGRYEPCEMLIEIYEMVYTIRNTLLALKDLPVTSASTQALTATKQVPTCLNVPPLSLLTLAVTVQV